MIIAGHLEIARARNVSGVLLSLKKDGSLPVAGSDVRGCD